MNIFLTYAVNFFCSGMVGVVLLSWFQNYFLNGDVQLFLDTLPLTILVPCALAAVIFSFAYLTLKPLMKILSDLKQENRDATSEEKQICIKAEKKLDKLTIIGMVMGFGVGVLSTYFIKLSNGAFPFEVSRTILVVIQAICFGTLGSIHTIFVTNAKFSKYRKMLKIKKLEKTDLSWKVNTSILTFVIAYICFTTINLIFVPFQIVVNQDHSIEDPTSFFLLQSGIVFLISFAVSFPSLFCILKSIKTRMVSNTDKIIELATNGDLSTIIDIDLFDDFGYMTSATNELIKSMSNMLGSLKNETDHVLESANVLSDVATTSEKANTLMSETFERINNETLRQNELIISVSNNVTNLTESAKHLKEYMLSESSAMQQNSASIAEMTANINSMANMTQKADALFHELTQTSDEGNKLVAQAVTSISEIQKASKEVQTIVKTIQEIASQTNLLSMNAAIESAHAGEFGTGFAVVADEVRSLATSSATSAKEIQAHIKDIVSKINSGVEAISRAGAAFKEIDQGVSENRELIKSLALAMEEQKIGAEETMKVTVEVTDALEKANELVREQNEYATNVRTAMDTVVASSAEVSRVIKDGNAATDNITDSVQMITQTSEQNKDVVVNMKKQIDKYII